MPVTRIIPSSSVEGLDPPSLPELPARLGAHGPRGPGSWRWPCRRVRGVELGRPTVRSAGQLIVNNAE
jgi:hypothetical protein